MKRFNFPIFKTKSEVYRKFDLTNLESRREYFEYKCGEEIKKLKEYIEKNNTFIAYLLGKKSSGKGTYSKMLGEVLGFDKLIHFSIGDMVRSYDEIIKDPNKKKEIVEFLKSNYRGYLPIEKVMEAWEQRSTKVLLPSELILTLAKKEIAKIGRKVIFIDGFPRDLDQVSYSLFFRDLIGYRDDPDVFVLIDVPNSVIDERIKFRVVCPLCHTSRNLKLLPTSKVGYDKENKSFYLLCDNPECKEIKMETKEGDELGIEPIRTRLEKDEMLIEQALTLEGIPKILLRNSIPVDVAKDFVDDYEITPEYLYNFNEGENTVEILEKPWEIKDDQGVPSYSLMPPPVVVSLIKQLVRVLGI